MLRMDTIIIIIIITEVVVTKKMDRAVAQTVSRRLPALAAWVRALVKSCEICGGQSGTGPSCLRSLQFPLSLIHSTDCSSIIIRASTIVE
jgi:hypothetical protein